MEGIRYILRKAIVLCSDQKYRYNRSWWNWSETGQRLVRYWSDTGQIRVRYGSDTVHRDISETTFHSTFTMPYRTSFYRTYRLYSSNSEQIEPTITTLFFYIPSAVTPEVSGRLLTLSSIRQSWPCTERTESCDCHPPRHRALRDVWSTGFLCRRTISPTGAANNDDFYTKTKGDK